MTNRTLKMIKSLGERSKCGTWFTKKPPHWQMDNICVSLQYILCSIYLERDRERDKQTDGETETERKR